MKKLLINILTLFALLGGFAALGQTRPIQPVKVYTREISQMGLSASDDTVRISADDVNFTGNGNFSGDIIASSGEIYLGASSPALTISGGSNANSGGQIQLNGEGASAADDIIFSTSGTERLRYDESQSMWDYENDINFSNLDDGITSGGYTGGVTFTTSPETIDIISSADLNTGNRLVLLCSVVRANGTTSDVSLVIVDDSGTIQTITVLSDEGADYNWVDNAGALAIQFNGSGTPNSLYNIINIFND